eukprot:3046609-Pyramimonas_sp.AAC.1
MNTEYDTRRGSRRDAEEKQGKRRRRRTQASRAEELHQQRLRSMHAFSLEFAASEGVESPLAAAAVVAQDGPGVRGGHRVSETSSQLSLPPFVTP